MENFNQHIKLQQGYTQLSIIKFVSNEISGENISIGLLAICEEQVFFEFSKKKLEFVRKINPQAEKLITFSISQFEKNVCYDLNKSTQGYLFKSKIVSTEYLDRLSNYNNGVLHFSAPQIYNFRFQERNFKSFFEKFIYKEPMVSKSHQTKISSIKQIVKEKLEPLKEKIDVDYTIRKQQLPSLLFDFSLDAIGVNGSVYSVKSIDLNSTKSVSDITREISEYESLLERINSFSENHSLQIVPQNHSLIVENYVGQDKKKEELSNILVNDSMPLFTVKNSSQIDEVTEDIVKSKAGKFSERLAV